MVKYVLKVDIFTINLVYLPEIKSALRLSYEIIKLNPYHGKSYRCCRNQPREM